MPIKDFPDRKFLINARELGERLRALTVIDLRPAEDFALGHIEGSRHLDLYGVSLNDSADAPLNAFLSIFRNLVTVQLTRMAGDRVGGLEMRG